MHTLIVQLKQHTPLIHFQHDQDGATLRASEVKPKLDRFILSKLTPGVREKGIEEGWIKNKNDKVWLDYKMRIESSNNKKEYLVASYVNVKSELIEGLTSKGISVIGNSPYFAQEKQNGPIIKSPNPERGWREIEKKGVKELENITIKIIFRDKGISKILSLKIQEFFISTNFGTRQNKGFGCFSPTSICLDGEAIQVKDEEELLKTNYQVVYKKVINTNSNDYLSLIFSTIKKDYQLMKSGFNPPKKTMQYKKSFLFCYGVTKMPDQPRWEKRFLKKQMKSPLKAHGYMLKSEKRCENGKVFWNAPICDEKGNQAWEDKYQYNYQFIRALLGLAEQYEFQLNSKLAKVIVKVEGGDDLQRFQSPITFKVIDNNIYLLGNGNMVKDILGKTVEFSFILEETTETNGTEITNRTNLNIQENRLTIPQEFNLETFLDFAAIGLKYKKI